MEIPYTAPVFHAEAFNCPNCWAFSHQTWTCPSLIFDLRGNSGADDRLWISRCLQCKDLALWFRRGLVFPITAARRPQTRTCPMT